MRTLQELFGGHFMSAVRDPYPVYAALRRDAPVALVDLPMQPGHVVTRYDDVRQVLSDGARYSSRANANGIGLVMGRTILEMDGREHARHRNIIAPAFVPKAIKQHLPAVIETMAHRLIDGFAGAGRADLVAAFTFTFPLQVIAHIIGVPIADFAQFHRWALDVIGFADDPARGFAAAERLLEVFRSIVAQRRATPTGDLLSTLVHAEVEGERLTDEEIYSFLRLLLPAGADTTYRLIGSTLYALLTHPDQFEAVRADRAQLAWAIEEALRWEAPVQFAARETTEPVALGGVDLPAGAQVLVALGSANRDERRYPDPDRFALGRRADDHLAFGFGRHFCVGSHLARLEATIALNALLDRLRNLRLDPSADAGVVGLAFRSPKQLPVTFDPA
jgi:cytochrome P450